MHFFAAMKLPGTATQEENISIAMGKLNIEQAQVFLDIGCGSGAVSLAASRYTDRIYGIDRRDEAVQMCKATVSQWTIFLRRGCRSFARPSQNRQMLYRRHARHR